jgi:FdhD protein
MKPIIHAQKVTITKWKDGAWASMIDQLSLEEPLEIRIEQNRMTYPVSVTMRTPGHDDELSLGFLFTEGLIKSVESVERVICTSDNVIELSLTIGTQVEIDKLKRNFYTTSSCGVCGKASIDAIRTVHRMPIAEDVRVNQKVLASMPASLRKAQSGFDQTGGLHASAIFTADGRLIQLREDVGRHNALDKLIGWAMQSEQLPWSQKVLLLSGRASFELIQKAAATGVQIVAAVGAPSSLAVELAEEFGITLIGFLKEQSMNIYCGEHRVLSN